VKFMFTLLPTGVKYLNTHLQSTPPLGFQYNVPDTRHPFFCGLFFVACPLICVACPLFVVACFFLLSFFVGPFFLWPVLFFLWPVFCGLYFHTLFCNLWLMFWSLINHIASKILSSSSSSHLVVIPAPLVGALERP
jgi:hypothetical protein